MPAPLIAPIAGKALTALGTASLVDDLTGGNAMKFLNKFLFGVPESKRGYTVDPNEKLVVDPLAMRERYGGSGDMDAGDSATYSPSTREYTFNSDTPPPAPVLPPPPSNNLPPSPDQSMMDPYAYNLAVYGQGRNLATTKDERAAVRDLGLAINRKLFPKLNKTQDINPLMQATFPERYNNTLTGNIESRGTTLPGSMTEADSGSELATAQVQDTPYQAQFMRGMQEAQVADANRMVEQLLGQAEVDEIRRRLGM
jgi:hypothetical protein